MIAVGEKLALDFPVKAVAGGVAKEVQFSELLRRRTVVSVHMKNNTPSCDRQVAALVGEAETLGREDYDVIAVSRDTCGSHARYAKTNGISFTLVSDPEDRLARAADSLVEKAMYGRTFVGPARLVFVLEADGTVRAVEKVDTARHGEQVRALIKSL